MAVKTEILPVSFGGHFGALHRPCADEAADVAVVICPPFGRDARCAYRALFCWAETLASQGFQVLRYDPLGEGDSAPLDRSADQWTAWLDGVAQASEFARTRTGARELVLVGLRMGGALALAAASTVKPDGLILLAPLMTGEAWLRDLRFSAAIQKLSIDEESGLEVDGLWLSPASVQRLKQLDTTGVAPTWRSAFLATPTSGRALAARLGPAVTVARFEGYSLFFKDPYLNQAPTQVLAEASAWLAAFAAGATCRRPSAGAPAAQLEGPGWIEHPIGFGDGLRGVICLPRRGESGRAVLVGNTAADPRAGVGNFATRASRALASEGVAALRFDFPGVGESAGERGAVMDIYAKSRVDDFRAAADVLKAHGYHDLTLMGVCTGGFHAVRAVIESGDFRRAVAFNAWLVVRPEWSLVLRSETADPEKRRTSARPEMSGWRKILRGEVDLGEALVRKAKQVWSSLWPDALCRRVRREIRAAGRGGAEIHVLLGRGDVAMRGLEADFGLNCSWLRRQRGVSVSVLPRLDHALFSAESQDVALHELFRIVGLDAKAASAASRRAPEVLQPSAPLTSPALGG